MTEIKLLPEKIAEFLISKISDTTDLNNSIFIFSTDTVMNSWIEYLISNPELSGTSALPLDKFIAWDNFKGKYLRAEKSDANTIPSTLRNFFVLDLISKNAARPKNERFQVIINPDDEYAASATSFADWICRNLPSLHFWKKRLEENLETYGELDKEDKDYLKLYDEYKNFLDKNGLYEPSWIEDLDFGDKTTNFYIFYPELLEDFDDFKAIFAKSGNITLLTMPEDIPNPKAYFYSDSRCELRQTILRIIELVQSGKADWSEIALSIPNLDVYRPYIEREFDLYNVPVEIRAGVPLTKNSAGRIFKEINACYGSNFSFDSIRSLLLDECVPWKAEHKDKREALVRVGNQMRCICSPDEKDIWFSALKSKINRLKNDKEQAEYYSNLEQFYGKIKHHINQFFPENPSFSAIAAAWQSFKAYFLESDDKFSKAANDILGRCISNLNEMISIENSFADCQLEIKNPYEYFLKEIDNTPYAPQKKNRIGVNVFSYRLAGPAYFKYQFVIDGSQKNLEVPYKRLTFLSSTKRSKLHLIDDDKKLRATEVFIKLYAKNTARNDDGFVSFSAAENTFSGFAIPHNLLDIESKSPDLTQQDYIINEKKYISSPEENDFPTAVTPQQKQSFLQWKKTLAPFNSSSYVTNDSLKEDIKFQLITNRNNKSSIKNKQIEDNKIKISARDDLENFFPCPRKWLLKSVLKLHDDTLDTNLMQSYDMGNLNHKILELYFSQFENKTLPFYDNASGGFKIINNNKSEEEKLLNALPEDFTVELSDIIDQAILSPSKFRDSPLVINALKKQKDKIQKNIYGFLKYLLLPYSNPDAVTPAKNIGGIGNCRLVGCEKTICMPSEKFDWYGKIDCLLLSPENDWIIVDYKNSKYSLPSKKDMFTDDNNLIADFQMPLYFKLIGEQTIHEISAGYFYAIKDSVKAGPVDKFVQSKNEHTATFELYKPSIRTLESYAEDFYEIVNPDSGTLNFKPHHSASKKDRQNLITYEHCIKCQFKGICRTTYTVGGKAIDFGNTNE